MKFYTLGSLCVIEPPGAVLAASVERGRRARQLLLGWSGGEEALRQGGSLHGKYQVSLKAHRQVSLKGHNKSALKGQYKLA